MSELGSAPSALATRLVAANRGQCVALIDSVRTMFQPDGVDGSSKIASERIKREHGRRLARVEAVAAPATVYGEPAAGNDHWETGKVEQRAETREPGDLPSTVPGLMLERGCSGIVGHFRPETPKALTRDRGQPASEGSMHNIHSDRLATLRLGWRVPD